MAKDIGRDKSTVSGELKRNGRHGRHGAPKAQMRAEARHGACRPHRKLDDPAPTEEARSRIACDHWSPEQAGGRLRPERGRRVVGFATIYRAVSAGGMDAPQATGDGRVRRRPRRKGRRSERGREEARGKIKISHDISERPVEANERSRLGDWEDDTVVGPGTACLAGIADRASRPLVGGRSEAHAAEAVGRGRGGGPEGRASRDGDAGPRQGVREPR
jgi:IS30 family transposase